MTKAIFQGGTLTCQRHCNGNQWGNSWGSKKEVMASWLDLRTPHLHFNPLFTLSLPSLHTPETCNSGSLLFQVWEE